MRPPKTVLVLAVGNAAMLLSVVPAAADNTAAPPASSVSIGQAAYGFPCAAENVFAIQAATTRPPDYSVPTGGGVVTSWSYASNAVKGRVQFVLAVPAGPQDWTIVARSAKATPAANTLNTFPTRVPVRAGAQLGLWAENAGMECTGVGTDDDLLMAAQVDPDTVSVVNTPSSLSNARVDVSAVVEPDADGDGYGDVTQDRCPQLATTQVVCPAPEITILSRPPRHLFNHRAQITFTSAPGTTFTCAVDGRVAQPCRSPFTRRFSPRRHLVLITATSQQGVVETTPARVVFRVLGRSSP